jgi:hypothetical protein
MRITIEQIPEKQTAVQLMISAQAISDSPKPVKAGML